MQKGGAGIGDNVQLELVAATAIGAGLASTAPATRDLAARWGTQRTRLLLVVIMMARLLVSSRMNLLV